MKKNVLILLSLGVATLAVWGVYFLRQSSSTRREAHILEELRRPKFYCENDGYLFTASEKKLAPLPCPKCGKDAVRVGLTMNSGLVRCGTCNSIFPMFLEKWPPDEKTKWEARLATGPLNPQEMNELHQVSLCKTTSTDWLTTEQFRSAPKTLRCPKCGNRDQQTLLPCDMPKLDEPAK